MARWDASDKLDSLPAPLRGAGGLVGLVVIAGALALAVIALTGALGRGETVEPQRIFDAAVDGDSATDPFAWSPDRNRELEQRAALGNSHVLYELSPGGILASARRTARFDAEMREAAKRHGVDERLMEAMVLLESAGRPDVIAGATDPANASGLAQILASTGVDLLGMRIDLDRSRELTAKISDSLAEAIDLRRRAAKLASEGSAKKEREAARLQRRGERLDREADRARSRRAEIDERFQPLAALDGMGLYLEIAAERFGRSDLAVTSYHMGIGNLTNVIEAYARESVPDEQIGELVSGRELSYPQLYFDSSPTRNQDAWNILEDFNDDSATYYWRVLAAMEIMRLYRDDREELMRLAELHGNKATSEEVFHPEPETEVFEDSSALVKALEAGDLASIPGGGPFGYRVGPQLGELADDLGVDRSLYRALSPRALATLIYMAGRVQAITGESGPKHDLIVTSAVRDLAYQQRLVGRNSEATRAYSLHTTGNSFDILREYANDRQARAFQFVLDRLKSLGVIDYAREPRAIHVTVSPLAAPLVEDA